MKDDSEKLDRIKGILSRSPVGKSLLDFAAANGTDIRFRYYNEHKAQALYWSGKNIVELRYGEDEEKLAASLGHELMHAWQDSNGLLKFKPDSPAGCFFHARMIEAVAHGVQSLIAHELKMSESPGLIGRAMQKHAKAKAFRRGFNRMSARRRDRNDRYSKRRYKISETAMTAPKTSEDIAGFEQHIEEITEFYGTMPNGQNILHDTGGLNKKQSKSIFAKTPKL